MKAEVTVLQRVLDAFHAYFASERIKIRPDKIYRIIYIAYRIYLIKKYPPNYWHSVTGGNLANWWGELTKIQPNGLYAALVTVEKFHNAREGTRFLKLCRRKNANAYHTIRWSTFSFGHKCFGIKRRSVGLISFVLFCSGVLRSVLFCV